METGRDGREEATSPGTDAQSPRKLEEAGRTLPWSLCRELGPGTPAGRLVSRAGWGDGCLLSLVLQFVALCQDSPGHPPSY